ncbi:MAG: hypothetical protein LBT65_05140 [Synergistaceae bacterium]|nr:hypothetical protein [Synergistaceae bacterium]
MIRHIDAMTTALRENLHWSRLVSSFTDAELREISQYLFDAPDFKVQENPDIRSILHDAHLKSES